MPSSAYPPTTLATGKRKSTAATISTPPSAGRIHAGSPVRANSPIADSPKANRQDSHKTISPTHQRRHGIARFLRRSFMGRPFLSRTGSRSLNQAVAGPRVQIEPVKFLQILDAAQSLTLKRTLPVKSVQHDTL